MKKIAITFTIMAMSIFCYSQNYHQSYHQTVYTNIDGTTYVTSISGHGSRSYVTTYEVTSQPNHATLEEIQQGAAKLHDRLNELAKEREEMQKERARYINEKRMKEKLEKGIITQEEYDAAMKAMEENQD